MEFDAEDIITIVLAKEAIDDETHLSLQDFVVQGKPMIPFYTSRALLEEATEGKEFPYPVMDIAFGDLIEQLQGDEMLVANLGTDQSYAFAVADLTGE